MKSAKAIMIGLDSLMPMFLRRLLGEGKLPNFRKLKSEGYFTDLISIVPSLTGAGWCTVASGAWPSTHGVEGHWVHYQGEPFYQLHFGYHSGVVRAERLWETAQRFGKRPMLLKYPGSWPSSITNGVQLSGCGGVADQDCPFQISHTRCFTNDPGARDVLAWDVTPVDRVTFLPATEWLNVPEGFAAALETTISITPEREGKPKTYQVGLLGNEQGGFNSAVISTRKDMADALAVLRPGEWSGWLTDRFNLSGEERVGYFKMKLVELGSDGQRFKLYMTSVHDLNEFSVPSSMIGQARSNVGPLWEEAHLHDRFAGWIDDETWMEICYGQMRSECDTALFMMEHCDWDLFMLQWHPIDYTLHQYWCGIDPGHPDYNPDKADYYWGLISRVYEMADELVGQIVAKAGRDTIIAVVGDHGHALWRTTFFINNLLASEGLLCVEAFEPSGRVRVNWSETKAFASDIYVYLNVRGRDPHGSVRWGEEYETLRKRIVDLLYGLRDPVTNEHIVSFVLGKEEAVAFGLYGGGIGDIVYCMKSGTRCVVTGRAGWFDNYGLTPDFRIFEQRKGFSDLSSEHSAFSPFLPEMHTMLLLRGPGVREGIESNVPARLIDVAPTIAYLLQIPAPAQAEGGIISAALAR